MPIRLNLLAEAQEAEEMRRQDPVKRALLVGSGAHLSDADVVQFTPTADHPG